jgi:hypothetical protein
MHGHAAGSAARYRLSAPGVSLSFVEPESLEARVTDFRRATVASFNALREDFGDLRTEMNERFIEVDNGFVEMRGKLDAAAAGQQRIVELIQDLGGGQGTPGA